MRRILQRCSLKRYVLFGAALFAISIGLAYVLYPHWRTFSVFATVWRTLPLFLLAMVTAMTLLWFIGGELRSHGLRGAGTLLCASGGALLFVVLIPYAGGGLQKGVHNLAALCFALFAAAGFLSVARAWRNILLGLLAGLQFGLCALELIFLARFNAHPVYPWVWVVLQLIITALFITSLYGIAGIIDKIAKK